MTHPDAEVATQTNEAAPVEEVVNTDAASFYDETPTDPTEPVDGEPDGDEGDFADDEADGEPEEDIAAPVGLKAEHRDMFAQLPKEAQRLTAEIISQRVKDTQAGVEKAMSAQREAERSAADRVAEMQRDQADQLQRFVQAFAPQPPQREHYRDNIEFLAARENYRDEMAQFEQVVQQINGIRGEADGHSSQRDQEWRQEQVKQLMSVPEFADEATRAEFITGIETFAVNELGYSQEEILQAGAKDIIALKKVKGLKAKADKWDAYVARRNERPRQSGKFVAKPAPAGQMNGQSAPTDITQVLYPNG